MARRGGTRPLPRLSCLRVSSRCRRDLELSWGLSVGPSEGGRARGRARRRRWGEAERAAAGRGGSAPRGGPPLPPDRELSKPRG